MFLLFFWLNLKHSFFGGSSSAKKYCFAPVDFFVPLQNFVVETRNLNGILPVLFTYSVAVPDPHGSGTFAWIQQEMKKQINKNRSCLCCQIATSFYGTEHNLDPVIWFGSGYMIRIRLYDSDPVIWFGSGYMIRIRLYDSDPVNDSDPVIWFGSGYRIRIRSMIRIRLYDSDPVIWFGSGHMIRIRHTGIIKFRTTVRETIVEFVWSVLMCHLYMHHPSIVAAVPMISGPYSQIWASPLFHFSFLPCSRINAYFCF